VDSKPKTIYEGARDKVKKKKSCAKMLFSGVVVCVWRGLIKTIHVKQVNESPPLFELFICCNLTCVEEKKTHTSGGLAYCPFLIRLYCMGSKLVRHKIVS